ncbi:hypothetical protein [Streptomyces sp. NRRL F-525]|uniref:hypothetical protein n=1 Tax=Streptomyces sp. NRRL F-525 TaxID=1463861 RepID=UPI000526B333|nr:hypothetical protein [Streptomyces sp. NRRL F-525]
MGAEAVLQQAVDLGDTLALYSLARVREEAGDRQGAEDLARQVVDRGNANALYSLALMRGEDRDRAGAEALARQAADRGYIKPLHRLAATVELFDRLWPNGLDPEGAPTPPRQL